jgi:hypothetical protein
MCVLKRVSEGKNCASVVGRMGHHLCWAMTDGLCLVASKSCRLEVKQAYSQTVRDD